MAFNPPGRLKAIEGYERLGFELCLTLSRESRFVRECDETTWDDDRSNWRESLHG